MSSCDGFGGGPYDFLLGQAAAAGLAADKMNTQQQQQQQQQEGETVPTNKKKRNKNRSSGSGLQLPSGSKTMDKSSGFLPKNGRKANGQHHHNNTNHNTNNLPRHNSDYEVLNEKEHADNRGVPEFNGNFNGLHSPRAEASAASWNTKQDNTKTVPDPSVIVERLIQLRDCIKQVTSITHSLDKTDEPVAGRQINNLNQMLQVLRTEEQENMQLLQQVLACREESGKSSAAVPVQRELSPIQVSSSSSLSSARRHNNPVQQGTNGMESDEPTGELFLRMLDSQQKFASIQEQQASLLRLQKQAAEKLAAARAFHDHIVQTSLAASATTGGGTTGSISSDLSTSSVSSNSSGNGRPVHSNALLLQEQDVCEDDASSGALALQEQSDEDILVASRPPLVPPRKEERQGTPSFDLEDIQKRITALRELQFDRQAQCDQLEEGLSASARSVGPEVMSREQIQRSTERQRQQLESKLRQLQEKKQQMNSLLAELSSLQCSHSPSDDQGDLGSSASPGSFASPVNSSSSHKAKVASEVGETQRKLRQLEEMKNTLRTLQRLTENIEQVDNSLNKEDLIPPPPPTRGRSQGHLDGYISLPSLKPDNLRRDCGVVSSAQFPARRHYEAEGRANEDADMQNVGVAAVPQNLGGLLSVAPSSNGNASGISRSASAASDSRSIDQKVKKLADAQSKLHHLKLLLSAMQQQESEQEVGEDLDSLPALLSSLQDAASPLSPADNQQDLGEESEDSGVGPDQAKIRHTDLRTCNVPETSVKSQRQLKQELEELLAERRHLDTLQDLSSLQYPAVPSPGDGLNNCRDRSGAEGGRSRADSQLATTFMTNEMCRHDNLQRESCPQRSEAKTLNSQANNNNSGHQASKSRSRSRSTTSPSVNHNNNNNNNVMCQNGSGSYSELSDQLSYNMALRDELRAQKAILQELLKQERSKQMGFSHNQDSQSRSESRGKTEKSEVGSIQCASGATVSPLDNQEGEILLPGA